MKEASADHWVYVLAPLFVYGVAVMGLAAWGDHGQERNPLFIFLRRIGDALHRLTGYPGWAMAGALTALTALATAAAGLYWDVAFHIDLGRDEVLFTPAHTMIVAGLGGIVVAAVIAVVFATLERSPAGIGFMGLRVPWSALVLGALGMGGLVAFPLDDLWHEAYGLDVTLWSPTHLQLVAGGSLATIPVWLMLAESRARPRANLLGRAIEVVSMGAILVGTSTFQGEFDFGVPQFQVLYLPVLMAAAGAFTLVLARCALGAGGAVLTVAVFLLLRAGVGSLVAGALNHTYPRFPLYIPTAVVVEVVALALGTRRRVRYALAAGLGAGTAGAVAELIWVELSGWGELSGNDLARAALVVPAAAAAAALLGAALARTGPSVAHVSGRLAAMAGVILALALAYPLPRNTGEVQAVIRLTPVEGGAQVEVTVEPPDAVRSATAFGVVAWQGGGRISASLDEVGPGRFVASRPVPASGDWKTLVALQRRDEVMAAPVYMPADPEIGASAVPALPERREAFVRNTKVLLREVHDGPAWPAVLGYAGLASVVGLWIALMAMAARRLPGDDAGPRRWSSPAAGPTTSDSQPAGPGSAPCPPSTPGPAHDGRWSGRERGPERAAPAGQPTRQ